MADTTTLGRPGEQGIVEIPCNVLTVNYPGIICFRVGVSGSGSVVDTPFYVWVSPSGVLRIHTAIPTDADADGTAVGDQTDGA